MIEYRAPRRALRFFLKDAEGRTLRPASLDEAKALVQLDNDSRTKAHNLHQPTEAATDLGGGA
jgi:hypothetical protein